MSSQTNTNDDCKINLKFMGREDAINRSYARVHGRLTEGKKKNIQALNQWLIPPDKLSDLTGYHLDIGFGMGDSLVDYAKNTHQPCVGIDVYLPGLLQVMQQALQYDLNHIRMVHGDVLAVLPCLPRHQANSIFVLFADPWPKKKQQKRRLIQRYFINTLLTLLKHEGRLWIATDCDDYAAHINHVLSSLPIEVERDLPLPIRPTKYQKRAIKLGHSVHVWALSHLSAIQHQDDESK